MSWKFFYFADLVQQCSASEAGIIQGRSKLDEEV
jgi:hypothetical protein